MNLHEYRECRVVRSEKLNEDYTLISIEVGEIIQRVYPGRFLMLRAWDAREAAFMRPYSIFSADPDAGVLSVLVKRRGWGSQKLLELQSGSPIRALGPLGNGYVICGSPKDKKIAVLGMGGSANGHLYLAKTLCRDGGNVDVFLEKEHVFLADQFAGTGCRVILSQNPAEELKAGPEKYDIVFGRSDPDERKAVFAYCKGHGAAGYAVLEQYMACGTGGCKGCVVETYSKDGDVVWRRLCKEGPVFPIEKVVKG